MNKTHVIEHLRFALEAQLQNAKAAAKAAHDAATHEESVAEKSPRVEVKGNILHYLSLRSLFFFLSHESIEIIFSFLIRLYGQSSYAIVEWKSN